MAECLKFEVGLYIGSSSEDRQNREVSEQSKRAQNRTSNIAPAHIPHYKYKTHSKL